jgi:hypothetical protein
MQRTRDNANRLELCSRIANSLLVDCERLREVLVCDLFEVVLVRDLSAGNEQTQ